MAQITAKLVQELREKSGAGMMDCKKALSATDGDFEAAFDHLRKQGLKTADKKAGRETGEGRVFATIANAGKVGAAVSVSCETDFVAKTPDMEAFLEGLCAHVIEHSPANVDEMMSQSWKGDGTVDDALKAVIGKLGENIKIADVRRYENPEGVVAAYVHHDNKKAALVSVTTGADEAKAAETLKDLCMHIVVFNPAGLNREDVPPADVEREREIYREEVKGKPEEIQEKIIAGKLEKFYASQIVTEQPWVKDDKLSVQKALEQSLGAGTRLEGFARYQVGS